MFQLAYLEQIGNRKLRREESLVEGECRRQGIEVVYYHSKQIQRRQLPLTRDCFICGDTDSVHGAMKLLEIEVPSPNDFPRSLEPFYCRQVWRSSVSGLAAQLDQGQEMFAKPAGRRKIFTGRVFSSPDELYFISGVSRQESLWCSEVVTWVSEYRVYVIESAIVSIDCYAGDASVALSRHSVEEALAVFRRSGDAPAAYGIDFGVLSTGETALVEFKGTSGNLNCPGITFAESKLGR